MKFSELGFTATAPGVGAGVGVEVGVGVGVGVGGAVGVGVGVGAWLGGAVGVAVGGGVVTVGVGVAVGVEVVVGAAVAVGAVDGVAVGVVDGVAVAVGAADGVGVAEGLPAGVALAVGFALGVADGAGVADEADVGEGVGLVPPTAEGMGCGTGGLAEPPPPPHAASQTAPAQERASTTKRNINPRDRKRHTISVAYHDCRALDARRMEPFCLRRGAVCRAAGGSERWPRPRRRQPGLDVRVKDGVGGHRAGRVLLALGYLCIAGLAFNLCVRFGLVKVRVPWLTGFDARWKLVLAAAVSFVCAWYLGRPPRGPGPQRSR